LWLNGRGAGFVLALAVWLLFARQGALGRQ
jgi:hypothetical protein